MPAPNPADRRQLSTTEELFVSAPLINTGSGVTDRLTFAAPYDVLTPVFVAPFPLVVKQISVAFLGGSSGVLVAASDTNYVTMSLRVERAGTTIGIIAAKTTRLSGEAITRRQAWVFDGNRFQWNEQYATLNKDDVVDLQIAATGTPANLTNGLVTVRYTPLGDA